MIKFIFKNPERSNFNEIKNVMHIFIYFVYILQIYFLFLSITLFIQLRVFSNSFFTSCSQNLKTVHHSDSSILVFSISLSLFLFILGPQYSILVLGILKQVGQPCQKHPSMKIAIFFPTNTISGLIQWILWCSLYHLIHAANNAFLSNSSTLVFFHLIFDIISLLFSFVILSAIINLLLTPYYIQLCMNIQSYE